MIPGHFVRNPRAGLAAIVLLSVMILAGCGGKDKTEAAKAGPMLRAVKTDYVRTQVLGGALSAPGVLISREEAAVIAEVNGYRVAHVLVDVGDLVKAGQPLVELDDTLLRSQIDQAQALANQSNVQAQQAAAQAQRVEGLDKTGALSTEQIEQRRYAAETAKAQAAAQGASLKDLQTRAGKLVVRAPVSGVIMERNVRPGDLSAAGGQPMLRIIRDGQVELQAQVPETSLTAIKPGTAAAVNLPDGRTINGAVRMIEPSVDANTKLGRVRITLPVEAGIRPGGYGQALFSGSTRSVTAAPETALRYDADGVSVMVVDQAHHVKQMKVTTGQRGGGQVELISGPPPGSRVLLGASSFVLEGDVVDPVDVAANAAPAPAPAPAAAPPAGKSAAKK